MDKKIRTVLMLDFYGQLLTERQDEILQMYYNHDLSLGEIAQNLGITRQGVYDNIKRSEKVLYNMEEKLGLVSRFMEQKLKITKALEIVAELEIEIKDNDLEVAYNKVRMVRNILSEVADH